MLHNQLKKRVPGSPSYSKVQNPQILKNVILRQKDVFEEMLYPDLDGPLKVCNKRSDVWLLLNLQRLDFSPSMVKMIDDRFASRQVGNPFAGLSDEDKFKMIKGKGIQTANELNSWLDYIENQTASLNVQASKIVELENAKKAKQAAQAVEPSPEGESA